MFPSEGKRANPGKSNQNETITNLLTSPISQQFYSVPPISPLSHQPILQVHSPINTAIVPQLPINTPGSIHNQTSRAKQQQQSLQQLKIQTTYPNSPILTNQPRNRPIASVAPVTPSTPSTSALVSELNSNSNTSTNNTVFFSEISNIMRGFGDCETPLNDSIILIEKILLQQLRSILQDAIEISVRRKQTPAPTKKDFEFLMRKHKVKLQRLRKYLKDLTYFKKHVRHIYGNQYPDYDADNTFEEESEDSDPEPVEKHDEEKVRRLFRADRISQVLNDQQYQDYHVARRASFLCRNNNVMKSRMRSWLSVPNDVRLTPTCLDILSFLAHETIATLVDYCILSRLNSSNRLTEPYSRLTSTIAHNVMHLCPEVSQGRAQDGVKPITVQEINEAMRRHNTMALKRTRLGTSFRGDCSNYKIPYLAI